MLDIIPDDLLGIIYKFYPSTKLYLLNKSINNKLDNVVLKRIPKWKYMILMMNVMMKDRYVIYKLLKLADNDIVIDFIYYLVKNKHHSHLMSVLQCKGAKKVLTPEQLGEFMMNSLERGKNTAKFYTFYIFTDSKYKLNKSKIDKDIETFKDPEFILEALNDKRCILIV